MYDYDAHSTLVSALRRYEHCLSKGSMADCIELFNDEVRTLVSGSSSYSYSAAVQEAVRSLRVWLKMRCSEGVTPSVTPGVHANKGGQNQGDENAYKRKYEDLQRQVVNLRSGRGNFWGKGYARGGGKGYGGGSGGGGGFYAGSMNGGQQAMNGGFNFPTNQTHYDGVAFNNGYNNGNYYNSGGANVPAFQQYGKGGGKGAYGGKGRGKGGGAPTQSYVPNTGESAGVDNTTGRQRLAGGNPAGPPCPDFLRGQCVRKYCSFKHGQ